MSEWIRGRFSMFVIGEASKGGGSFQFSIFSVGG